MTNSSHQPVIGPPLAGAKESASPVPTTPPPCRSLASESSEGSEHTATLHTLMTAVATADPRFRHVSVVHPRTTATAPVLATTPLARAMAAVQLAKNDGAITETIRTGLPVIVTGADRGIRFPAIQPEARRLGVGLQLAVPLVHGTRTVGAFSLYATEDADVDLPMLELAQALAAQAAALLELEHTAAALRDGMLTRQRIGQACGILMSRFVLTNEQAFSALARASQNRNVKVRDLAHEVIAIGTLAELEQFLGTGRH